MPVRVGGGELHAGRIHRLAGHTALPGVRVQGELEHVARCDGRVGQPDFFIEAHVELSTQANRIKYDGAVFFQFGVTKVEDLNK